MTSDFDLNIAFTSGCEEAERRLGAAILSALSERLAHPAEACAIVSEVLETSNWSEGCAQPSSGRSS